MSRPMFLHLGNFSVKHQSGWTMFSRKLGPLDWFSARPNFCEGRILFLPNYKGVVLSFAPPV